MRCLVVTVKRVYDPVFTVATLSCLLADCELYDCLLELAWFPHSTRRGHRLWLGHQLHCLRCGAMGRTLALSWACFPSLVALRMKRNPLSASRMALMLVHLTEN